MEDPKPATIPDSALEEMAHRAFPDTDLVADNSVNRQKWLRSVRQLRQNGRWILDGAAARWGHPNQLQARAAASSLVS